MKWKNEVDHLEQNINGLIHGINILEELVNPLEKKGNRIECSGSYFVSAESKFDMKRVGFRFICAAKTAHERFSVETFVRYGFAEREHTKALVTHDEKGNVMMMAFVWVGREYPHLITV